MLFATAVQAGEIRGTIRIVSDVGAPMSAGLDPYAGTLNSIGAGEARGARSSTPKDVVVYLEGPGLERASRSHGSTPELWHQKAYLARVVTADPDMGIVDDGILPLAHVLDAGGPNAVILTLEADGSGSIYPVVYSRVDGEVTEHALEPHPMLDIDTPDNRRRLAEIARELVGPAVTAG